MASRFIISLLLALTVSISFSASSLPRRALPQAAAATGFRVELRHVDHGKNLTKLERLGRRIKRGSLRLQRLTGDAAVSAPVKAGNGEFLMKLAIGTPATEFSAIMDTGSDLIWTQCKPCTSCFAQKSPLFDPAASSSYATLPCTASLCKVLSTSSCGADGCEYFYGYGDSSTTEGVLSTETLTFGSSDASSVKDITFGCGGDNEGDGFSQGSGLVGLGRGPLSLISQLGERRFSYCLTAMADDAQTSSLLIGSLAQAGVKSNGTSGPVITTPLVKNPSRPSFYYLSLEGITVGDARVDIEKDAFAVREDGSGGLIIDSGTTITYLEREAFKAVRDAFVARMALAADESGSQGLELCFGLPEGAGTVEVPKMVFHFTEADLELPAENYVVSDSELGVLCLAMGSSKGMSIFGNVQQQNMLVVHDLHDETLSFVPTQCDRL